MVDEIVEFFVYSGFFLVLVYGSVAFAARSSPHSRYGRVRWQYLLSGAALSVVGLALMASIAWAGRGGRPYGWGSDCSLLEALMGGGMILFGLGPRTPWLLGGFARHSVRLPLPVRLAVRDIAGNRVRSAPAVTVTMVATALAITAMIGASAISAQQQAAYVPQARPGTLLVRAYSEDQKATVAAIQQELPGVPIAHNKVLLNIVGK